MRHKPPANGQRISGVVPVNTNRGKGVSTPRGSAYRLGKSIFHQASERQMPTGMFTLNLFGNRNKFGC